MRQLVIVFVVLFVIALGAGVIGLLLIDDIPGRSGPTVISWHLDGRLMDYDPQPSFLLGNTVSPTSLVSVYKALVSARSDPAVKGLALSLHNTGFGLAKAQEIRRLLLALRDEGKFVDCYLEAGGEGTNGTLGFYVATACGTIHLAPAADLNLLGLHADLTFLRGTFDKLKIQPDFVHIGKYKSAVESYTEYESSADAKAALEALLDDYYAQIVGAISSARGLPQERVRELVDGAPYTAAEALELGLVDKLSYADQFEDAIEEAVGSKPDYVQLGDYDAERAWRRGKRVALVFAQGSIRRGFGGIDPWTGSAFIGSRDLTRILRELSEDRSIAAVVLRIDSPGGSALASDLILREVDLLADTKPVIVSMSDLAASGGYYIAATATRVVAEEATLTGSIGVFGGKLVTRRFESEFLGLSHDSFKRGENADIYSSLEPFTPAQAERVGALMERVYDDFRGLVARGRDMSLEEVEAVAQGRVWSGSQALEIGLIDDLGGLDRSLELVRESLGLSADAGLRLELYPRPPNLFDFLLGRAQTFLPIRLPAAFSALAEDQFHLLQLPAELARISNPF